MGPIPLPLCSNTHRHKQLYLLGTEHTKLFWTDSQIIFKQSGLVLKNFLLPAHICTSHNRLFLLQDTGSVYEHQSRSHFYSSHFIGCCVNVGKAPQSLNGGGGGGRVYDNTHRWTFKTETVMNKQIPVTCLRGKRVHKEDYALLMRLTTCLDAGESGWQSARWRSWGRER